VIAALADNAMGLSYGATLRHSDPEVSASAVTLTLSLDYVAIARNGAWLNIRPRVLKAGRSIGFVESLIFADEEVVARASATFKRVAPNR
jgi:acyl-coenzyme A thioesterase PaaI-like protein